MDDDKNKPEKNRDEAQKKLLSKVQSPSDSKENELTKKGPLSSEDFRLQRLLKHHEYAMENKSYSVSRFDILVISISGGGIYIIFETLKFYKEKTNNIFFTNDLSTIAGLIFTISIILNFLSQWTCFNANKHEEKWVNQEIKKVRNEKYDPDQLKKHDKFSRWFNRGTSWLNVASGLVMFTGIILLALFNFRF